MNARGPYVASSLGHLIVLGTLLTVAALQQSPAIVSGVRIVSLPGRGKTTPAPQAPRPAAPVEPTPKVEPVVPAPVPKAKVQDKAPPKRDAVKPADSHGVRPAAKPEIVSKSVPKATGKPPVTATPPRPTPAAPSVATTGATGTATVGVEAEGADGLVSSYLALLRDKVASNWEPPPEIGRSGAARTIVTFVIGRDGGAPLSVRVEGESGVSIYDRKALAAIENSKPFQPLPSGWENDSIAIRFTFQQEY